MIFQRVLKGIPAKTEDLEGLTGGEAQAIVNGRGVVSNWWRNAPGGAISPEERPSKLTEGALRAHLVEYERVRDETPFISTTAGTVERDAARGRNVFFPPMYTALRFATRDFTQDGYVVHAYVFLLGRRSIELEEFAEEVRDLHTYTSYYDWHPEGEIVAKVHIPARQIEKVELYGHVGVKAALDKGSLPSAESELSRADIYKEPLQYANVRGFPELE